MPVDDIMPVPENLRITQLDLELNGGCNYKCEMCPQVDGREKEFLKVLPYDVIEKILEGKMNKFFSEVTFFNQTYILDADKTVRKIIQSRQIDGQLKESSLTRAEIEIILRAFVSVWRRMRHRRLKYPSFNSR